MALVLAEAQVQAQEVVEDDWDIHRRHSVHLLYRIIGAAVLNEALKSKSTS